MGGEQESTGLWGGGRQGVGWGVDWSVETSAVPPRTGTEEWLFHWAEWLLEPFEECFSGVPG